MFSGLMSIACDAAAVGVAAAAAAFASDVVPVAASASDVVAAAVSASASASDVVAVGDIHHPMNYSTLDFASNGGASPGLWS